LPKLTLMGTEQNDSTGDTSSEPAASVPETPPDQEQASAPAQTDEQAAPASDQGEESDDPTIPASEPPLQEEIPPLDESAPIPHLRLAGESANPSESEKP
jgi:hypothetical protein